MISQPKIETRPAQPYAAVRTHVSLPFGSILGPLWGEVHTWLANKGLSQSGAPFIRYLVTDRMPELDIEVGWPVAAVLPGEGRITTGIFPSGPYAVMLYTGSWRGKGLVKATGALLAWAEQNHVVWNTTKVDGVDWWEARLENYLTDPAEEPDPQKWQTELAFLTVG